MTSTEGLGMSETVKSPRERYRAQVRDEIKAHAWAQVATTGAAALSLNAIAKQMGISGPALYRYFHNRDELMTELVLDAYRDLSATCRAAAATAHTPTTRLAAVADALRRWAVAEPHRYLLIYGTPVPGYAAPPEATALAASIMSVLMDAFAAADAASDAAGGSASNAAADTASNAAQGTASNAASNAAGGTASNAAAGTAANTASDAATRPVPTPAATLDRHLATHRQWAADHPAPPAALRRALTFWTRLHGVVSLEVAGHFTGMHFDPALLYAAEADAAITAP